MEHEYVVKDLDIKTYLIMWTNGNCDIINEEFFARNKRQALLNFFQQENPDDIRDFRIKRM
tara:strand:- start:893 stop:1075 length:183 start_codon:yes stop_codon:yes gene_type:complete